MFSLSIIFWTPDYWSKSITNSTYFQFNSILSNLTLTLLGKCKISIQDQSNEHLNTETRKDQSN